MERKIEIKGGQEQGSVMPCTLGDGVLWAPGMPCYDVVFVEFCVESCVDARLTAVPIDMRTQSG